MSIDITPKLPSNPTDGEEVADEYGNIYRYNSEENSWIQIGIIPNPPIVSETKNGLISPTIYAKLKELRTIMDLGVDFGPNKIYVGSGIYPYFYYLNSNDGTIRFKPETLENGQKLIRIEVNRAHISSLLTRTPCIGVIGPRGGIGDKGRNGIPAAKEKFYQPTKITTTTFEFNNKVNTPLSEPLSLRIFNQDTQILEILISVAGTDYLEFVDTEEYEVDEKNTHIHFDSATNIVSGKIVLKKGAFTLETNVWRYKIRQRGPQGKTGINGDPLFELNVEIPDDSLVRFEKYVSSLRTNSKENILFIQSQASSEICTTSLAIGEGTFPSSQYALAIEQTTKNCKDIGFYTFNDEVKYPELKLPAWTPMKKCDDRRRYELSKFQWFNNLPQINTQNSDCITGPFPFTIITDPSPPEMCCRDNFFMCGNLGDACAVEGLPRVRVPPQPASVDSSNSGSSGSSSSSGSNGSSGSSSSSSPSSSSSASSTSSSSNSSQSSNGQASSSSAHQSSSSSATGPCDCDETVITSPLFWEIEITNDNRLVGESKETCVCFNEEFNSISGVLTIKNYSDYDICVNYTSKLRPETNDEGFGCHNPACDGPGLEFSDGASNRQTVPAHTQFVVSGTFVGNPYGNSCCGSIWEFEWVPCSSSSSASSNNTSSSSSNPSSSSSSSSSSSAPPAACPDCAAQCAGNSIITVAVSAYGPCGSNAASFFGRSAATLTHSTGCKWTDYGGGGYQLTCLNGVWAISIDIYAGFATATGSGTLVCTGAGGHPVGSITIAAYQNYGLQFCGNYTVVLS